MDVLNATILRCVIYFVTYVASTCSLLLGKQTAINHHKNKIWHARISLVHTEVRHCLHTRVQSCSWKLQYAVNYRKENMAEHQAAMYQGEHKWDWNKGMTEHDFTNLAGTMHGLASWGNSLSSADFGLLLCSLCSCALPFSLEALHFVE